MPRASIGEAVQSEFRWAAQSVSDPRRGSSAEVVLFPGLVERHVGRGEYRGLEFLHVEARTIINRVPDSSPVPFRFTINPYRGCSHACTYCFARPTHEYLNLNSGEDFDRRIVVKVNAVEVLRRDLGRRSWKGEHLALGTNTDPYQRAEGRYRLTRGILETLLTARNPFSILTKSSLILRDLDVLAEAATAGLARCDLSVGTLDEDVWRMTEPGTPHPGKRIEAVAKLNEAGVPCGVLIAPVLPGLSDRPEQIDAVVGAALGAGAVSVSGVMLHLRSGVREHYMRWLRGSRPDLLALHHALYDGGAYAPQERGKVSAMIDDALAARGASHTPLDAWRGVAAERRLAATDAHPVAPPAEQLSLLG